MYRAGLILGLAALVFLAQGPVLRTGFTGAEYQRLARATAPAEGGPVDFPTAGGAQREPRGFAEHVRALAEIEGGGSPLAGLWLRASRVSWAGAGALPWRLENLLVLALAALGVASFLRRLLLPWIGSDHARAAALCAGLLLCIHPKASTAAVGLEARGELLALAFGSWACATFLRGRQDRRPGFTALAVLLALLAGASAPSALVLPFGLALAELLSAHRYRPTRVRARTTATTFLVFGALVSVQLVLRGAVLEQPLLNERLAALLPDGLSGGWSAAGAFLLDRLGVLLLPAQVSSQGILGIALAGMVFLLAVQPSLVAARSAPRLWGWVFCAWLCGVFAGEIAGLAGPGGSVAASTLAAGGAGPASALPVLARAEAAPSGGWLPAAAVMCAGLGIASTALSGLRRRILPPAIALGYAVLAHGHSLPLARSATEAGRLLADVSNARFEHGRTATLVILDPPQSVVGPEGAEPSTPESTGAWITDPRITGDPLLPRGGGPLCMQTAAFLEWIRMEEFAGLRDGPVLVVLPARALTRAEGWSEPRGRLAVLITPPQPSTGPRSWRGASRSPDLDVDPLGFAGLRVQAPPSAAGRESLHASWRSRNPRIADGTRPGAWLAEGDAPEILFDLESSLAWCLSGRVRRIWFEGGLPLAESVQLLERMPELPLRAGPSVQGDDWTFVLDPAERGSADGSYRLSLLELETRTLRELSLVEEEPGVLRASGAAELTRGRGREQAWTLRREIGGATVARTRGRWFPEL